MGHCRSAAGGELLQHHRLFLPALPELARAALAGLRVAGGDDDCACAAQLARLTTALAVADVAPRCARCAHLGLKMAEARSGGGGGGVFSTGRENVNVTIGFLMIYTPQSPNACCGRFSAQPSAYPC